MARKPTYKELEKKITDLKKETSNYKVKENALRKKSHDLTERVKELNCLYGIDKIQRESGGSVEEQLQAIINLLPSAWQYPKITCIRLILNDQVFITKNFKETIWKQSSKIILHDESIGILEVYYLEEKTEIDEGPFLKEERTLINAIAERLGKMIRRELGQDSRRELEEKYRLLVEAMNDGLGMIDENGLISYVNNRFIEMVGYSRDEIIGESAYVFFGDTKKIKEQPRKKKNKVRSPYEVHFTTKDGKEVSAIMSEFPLLYPDGSFRGSFKVITDISKLKKAEQSLKKREMELEDKTVRLEESNAALKVLLNKRDEDKKELEEKVLSNVKVLISPYIEKLEKCRLNERQMGLLSIINSNLDDIVSPFLRQVSLNYLDFTPSEIQISNLIKEGRTTKEIAELLVSSIDAIKFHRKNIRKKFGLVNRKSNLRSYLLRLG